MKVALVVFAACCAVLAALVVGAVLTSHPSTASDQSDVIDACQQSVRGMLKDPDSARFNGWTAWEAAPRAGVAHYPDEKDYSAKGMVNAKNGFGGYGGDEPYSCDASATTGTVHATARTG